MKYFDTFILTNWYINVFLLTQILCVAFGGCSNEDEMIGKKWWGNNSFDEKSDDKKLDKGDGLTLRIIYI